MIVIIIDNFIRKLSYIFGIEFIVIKTTCNNSALFIFATERNVFLGI